MKNITPELLDRMHEHYASDRNAHTLNAAYSKTDLADLAFLPMNAAKLNGEFALEIKTHGITAQEQSGRCWMFASMNIVREQIIRKLNLDSFELSGNYLAFWDKLEKANNFLESIILSAKEPINSQRVIFLLTEGIGDGGWWGEFVDLIQKYGVVPKTAMPECQHSGHTAKLLVMWNRLLRKDAMELRHMIEKGLSMEEVYARKEQMLLDFYRAECIAFGEPPKAFDFCYRDKDEVFHAEYSMTPQDFFKKYVDTDLEEYIYIACQPSELHPYHTRFTIHAPGNMADESISFINLPIEEVKELVLKQMRDDRPVWFGCDALQFGERTKGYWDPDSFDYEGILGGVDLWMNKEDLLVSRESYACHDMVLCGVNFDAEGKPDRWKIANSWGDKWGMKGYFVASDRFFNEYVYEAVIDKKYLSPDQLALINSEPIVVEPWEV